MWGLGFRFLQLIQCNVRSRNSLSKNKSGVKFYSIAVAKALPVMGPTLQNQGAQCWGQGAVSVYCEPHSNQPTNEGQP